MRAAFTLLLLATSLLCLSQQSNPNNLDEKYEPKAGGAASQNSSERNKATSLKEFDVAFKFNPSLLTRKIVAAGLEYSPAEFVSFEGLIGYGIGIDPMMKMGLVYVMEESAVVSGSGYDLARLLPANGSTEYSGIFLQGEIKFFLFGEDNFDGGYFGFAARRSAFGFELDKSAFKRETSYEISPGSKTRVDVNYKSFYGTYGDSFKSGKKDQIVHQFYMGLGFRFTRYTSFVREDNYSPYYGSTQQNTTVRSNGLLNRSMDFSIILGYSIGFGI